MIKKLLLATFGGAMFATPALAAYTPEYFEGYREGINVGVFIAYCQAYTEGDYKDLGLSRHMAHASYGEMDASNREWARDNYPHCTP